MGETIESSHLDGNQDLNSGLDRKNCSGSSGLSGASMPLNGCSSLGENSAEAKEKKGSFQITRVISRSGEGEDRAWLDYPGASLDVTNTVYPEDATFCSKKEAADRLQRVKNPQSRFRLVKIESEEGVRHGRWLCLDFEDSVISSAVSGGVLELSRSASTLEYLVSAGGTYDDVKTPSLCYLPTSGAGHFVGNIAFELAGQGNNLDCGSAISDDPSTVNWISHSPGLLPVELVSPSAAFPSSTFDTTVEKELFRALPSFDSECLGNGNFASSFQFFHENLFAKRARKPSDTNEEGLDDG